MDTLGHQNGEIGMYYCHGMGGNQRFRLDGNGVLYSNENCLYPQGEKLKITECKAFTSTAKWTFNEVNQFLLFFFFFFSFKKKKEAFLVLCFFV